MENKDTITAGTGERTWCVYLYMFPDGMFYYGKSSVEGLERRHREHACSGYDIGVWIRRWRLKRVEVKPEPVEFFGSESAALVREKELIEETDAVNKGLNMCEGGGQPPSSSGRVCTDETRAKQSAARKKYLAENPHPKPMLGKKHSEETRAKMVAVRRTPEMRAKVSVNVKKRWSDPAHRAKVAARVKKAYADSALRAKISEMSKTRWSDPKVQVKMSAAMKRGWTPEVRANHSANMKKAYADPAVRARKCGANNPRARRVVCLDDGKIFGAAVVAERHYGLYEGAVKQVCRGVLKTAGGRRFAWV